MKLRVHKNRCNYPHGHSRFLAIFESNPLCEPICKSPLYRWGYYYSIVTAIIFTILNLFQCIHLCCKYPEKTPRSVRSLLSINMLPECGFFKVIVHDIRLLCYAFALETNAVLLYDLIRGHYASLLVYLALTGAILGAKLFLTIFQFLLCPADFLATEFIFQMFQVFLLIFNWSQVCCTVFNYYDNCLFVDQYSPN